MRVRYRVGTLLISWGDYKLRLCGSTQGRPLRWMTTPITGVNHTHVNGWMGCPICIGPIPNLGVRIPFVLSARPRALSLPLESVWKRYAGLVSPPQTGRRKADPYLFYLIINDYSYDIRIKYRGPPLKQLADGRRLQGPGPMRVPRAPRLRLLRGPAKNCRPRPIPAPNCTFPKGTARTRVISSKTRVKTGIQRVFRWFCGPEICRDCPRRV